MSPHNASSAPQFVQDSASGIEEHFRKLEHLYRVAPVTRWYGASLRVRDGEAEVSIPVRPEFHHAAHAVHGSVYFRALDDAAFMAVNSRVRDVLVVTVGFNVHLTNPVSEGELLATGRVVHESGRLFVAEADLRDGQGRLLATGSGTFSRSRVALGAEVGYRECTGSQNILDERCCVTDVTHDLNQQTK